MSLSSRSRRASCTTPSISIPSNVFLWRSWTRTRLFFQENENPRVRSRTEESCTAGTAACAVLGLNLDILSPCRAKVAQRMSRAGKLTRIEKVSLTGSAQETISQVGGRLWLTTSARGRRLCALRGSPVLELSNSAGSFLRPLLPQKRVEAPRFLPQPVTV